MYSFSCGIKILAVCNFVTEADIGRSRRFFKEKVGHFKRKFQVGRGIVHKPLLVSEN